MISLKLLCFLLCLPLISSRYQGKSLHRQKRIIYGQTVKIFWYNYQISLEENGNNYCSGALLSRDWGTSAAVCLAGKTNWRTDIRARLGSTARGKGGALFNLTGIYIHEQYNSTTFAHNILVFTVYPRVHYNALKESINIARPYSTYKVGREVEVSGYGISDENGGYPYFLKASPMPIVSSTNCKKKYANATKTKNILIGRNQICISSKHSSACKGDTGAPAVYKNILIGIVSTSMAILTSCSLSLYPTILINIGKYYWWIRAITKIPFPRINI